MITKKSKEEKKINNKKKKINNIEDIDVNNILVSKNSHKYFIGYNDNDNIRRLCIRLPQITGYTRKFNENSTMFLIVKDKKLLKKI